mmetsp:Transcript_16831/g.36419  ORF Transcript_16831/g.36419 Transcript_16831/m.36419 type:complete len:231 (-) Transcript_16831:331-1023(-)
MRRPPVAAELVRRCLPLALPLARSEVTVRWRLSSTGMSLADSCSMRRLLSSGLEKLSGLTSCLWYCCCSFWGRDEPCAEPTAAGASSSASSSLMRECCLLPDIMGESDGCIGGTAALVGVSSSLISGLVALDGVLLALRRLSRMCCVRGPTMLVGSPWRLQKASAASLGSSPLRISILSLLPLPISTVVISTTGLSSTFSPALYGLVSKLPIAAMGDDSVEPLYICSIRP